MRRRSGLRQPNEGKYTAKWGLQIAEMIFQTRSRTYCYTYLSILHPNEQLYLYIPSFLRDIQ